jgi:hypothetical protein
VSFGRRRWRLESSAADRRYAPWLAALAVATSWIFLLLDGR